MSRDRLSGTIDGMHAPSLITSAVATAVLADHAETARLHRSRGRARIRGRRKSASRNLVPRGRIVSPGAS
jgi:hypothetical protein